MLSNFQLNIAHFYNILISNIKTLVTNIFDKERYVLHYENFQLFETRITY